MIYEQFLKEVVIDFNSLFDDFWEQLIHEQSVETFDQYFQQVTNDLEMVEELYTEAERFGVQTVKFQQDLYKEVKNFRGQIDHKINELEIQISTGEIEKEHVFKIKTTQNKLKQALA
ncbi:hypothetical protein [Alkalihalobacillus pseudalcaliphilus]|uniref:hypothetical protein n=1 Tax=Alkalihalobacillus pseudalcaliphilus TaxID=79884 RepID=UPI00064DD0F8|nr:hypothetical protein [Alkalihalobacillus pseudalcaliphilus]KMK76334.1 hypothetical protein AB990_14105 [Alkalihalobacillus pseudalcaliphilus]